MYNRVLKYSTFFFLVFVIYTLTSKEICAKSTANDPLNKPSVWKKIQDNPGDDLLWSAYIGKPWCTMTIFDKNNIAKWKKEVHSNMVAQNQRPASEINAEKHKEAAATAEFWDGELTQEQVAANEKIKQNKELQAYFKSMEQSMMSEPDYIEELKRNLITNFVIIDESYREEFETLGIAYKSYYDVHPNGKYPPEKWVEEKGRELRSFKRKQFEEMKGEMMSAAK